MPTPHRGAPPVAVAEVPSEPIMPTPHRGAPPVAVDEVPSEPIMPVILSIKRFYFTVRKIKIALTFVQTSVVRMPFQLGGGNETDQSESSLAI
jgi:hypothetical protein